MDGLKRFLRDRRTIRVAQIATGVIFLFAALPKIGDMGSFALQIHNYRAVPVALENLMAITLPWIELVIALALLLGIHARSGAVLSAGLMVVFLLAIGQAVARGLDIDCGCFGTTRAAEVGIVKMAEDVGFLVLALVASLRAR
jgi:uncharacterized membrane protein YphA (DoxX/SURF4 family)